MLCKRGNKFLSKFLKNLVLWLLFVALPILVTSFFLATVAAFHDQAKEFRGQLTLRQLLRQVKAQAAPARLCLQKFNEVPGINDLKFPTLALYKSGAKQEPAEKLQLSGITSSPMLEKAFSELDAIFKHEKSVTASSATLCRQLFGFQFDVSTLMKRSGEPVSVT